MDPIDLAGADSVSVELTRVLADDEMSVREAEWSRRLRGLAEALSEMAQNWTPQIAQDYMAKILSSQEEFAAWRQVSHELGLAVDEQGQPSMPGARPVATIARAAVQGQTIRLEVPPGGWGGFHEVGFYVHTAIRAPGMSGSSSGITGKGMGADELATACTVLPAGSGPARPYVLGQPLLEGDVVVIDLGQR